MEGLLIANQTRGTDSTGVAAIDFDGQFDILKVADEPWDFVRRKETQAILRRNVPIMIGHTRMTSMGNDVTDENAHPFLEDNVIGAHNGVINNYLELDKTVRVDSQAVIRMLSDYPDAYDWVFQQVSGSCALTWYDKRDPRGLYIVAHSNPLSAAIISSIETVFWSSESAHLEPIMRAVYGKDVSFVEIKKDTVYRLDSSDVWAWQEMPVSFRGYTRTYRLNGETYSWDDEEALYDYYGYSARQLGSSKKEDNTDKDEDKGKSSPLNLPAVATSDEEDRYEDYWNRLMDVDSLSESDDDNDGSRSVSGKPQSGLHDLTESQYQQLESGMDMDDEDNLRFAIDGVEDVPCGYCDKPAGENSVWDAGLEIILCRPCQNWWDKYGSGLEGNYPQPTA